MLVDLGSRRLPHQKRISTRQPLIIKSSTKCHATDATSDTSTVLLRTRLITAAVPIGVLVAKYSAPNASSGCAVSPDSGTN